MGYLDDLKAQYDNIFNSQKNQLLNKYNSLKQDTNADINNYTGQLADVGKQYDNLLSTLQNQQTSDVNTSNQQKAQGDQGYLQQSNQVAANNIQNQNKVQQWMAAHNLLQSGENVDAMLEGQSQLNNGLHQVNAQNNQFDTSMAQKMQDLLNTYASKRNDLTAQRQAQENTLNNNISALKQKLLGYDDAYNNDLTSAQQQNYANYLNSVNQYNLQQQQLASQMQKAQAAAQAKANKPKTETQMFNDAKKQIQDTIESIADPGDRDAFLQKNRGNIINSLGGDAAAVDAYQKYLDDNNKYLGYYHGGYQYM